MRENEFQNRQTLPDYNPDIPSVPQESQPSEEIQQPDWYANLTNVFAKKIETVEALDEFDTREPEVVVPLMSVESARASVYEANPMPEAVESSIVEVDFASQQIAEIAPQPVTDHDPEEFFRQKLPNLNKLRARREREKALAEIETRENEILDHREFAKRNQASDTSMIEYLLKKDEIKESDYYLDYFISRSPFAKMEITDKDLIDLESRSAVHSAKMFGQPDPDIRREFCYLGNNTWFFHESGENEISIHYIRDENGVQQRDHKQHFYLDQEALANFNRATQVYHDHVSKVVYRRMPSDINGDGILDRAA